MTTQHSFDKASWIQQFRINDKKLLYLDTFAWKGVLDVLVPPKGRPPDLRYTELVKILNASTPQKLFVGVNIYLISEIIERDDAAQIREMIKILDTYAGGIYLIENSVRIREELRHALTSRVSGRPIQKMEREKIFGPAWEIFGNLVMKVEKDGIYSDEDIQTIFKGMSLLKISDFPSDTWSINRHAFKHYNEESLKERYKHALPAMDGRSLLEEEKAVFAKAKVAEVLKIADDLLRESPQRATAEILIKESKDILYDTPTFNVYTTLHACLRRLRDPIQGLKVNHFYDVFQLASAIPYADYVVCDKEMAHICKQELKFEELYGCKFFTANEIGELSQILSS